jgi:ATP-dependent DNA helicase RecG
LPDDEVPDPETPIARCDALLSEIPPATRSRLAKLRIGSDFDLILHLPIRYEDETRLQPIRALAPGRLAQIEGRVLHTQAEYRPRRMLVVEVADSGASINLRFLNFYPGQIKLLQPGVRLRVLGECRQGMLGLEMVHPRYRVVAENAPLPDTLTPVYPSTAGLSQSALRALVGRALRCCDLSDTLPPDLLRRYRLAPFASSITVLHAPPPATPMRDLENRTHAAWRRLKFDELLAQQLSMRLHYHQRTTRQAPVLKNNKALTDRLIASLPFELTGSQRRVLSEISHDLSQPYPMHRLLQGDVGSGKTVVAALACAQTIGNGYQAVLMAPTEILAEQHFRKIEALLRPLGVSSAWLVGALKRREKYAAMQTAASGAAQLIIGTHALFQESVRFRNLGLAVIDEQHRFGVAQRLALHLKGGHGSGAQQPHQLMMSATPIPRTLSMSYFADLDVSVIDELPPGRAPVNTKLLAATRRGEVIERVREACRRGVQAYWVCPLIEESDTLQLQTAWETYTALQGTFRDLKVGLIHGRLAPAEKGQLMQDFEAGCIQLLVATTVIEVGVDVANATLMVIENAERMGLAQLHQLRGRVGRGNAPGVCILMYQKLLSQAARTRLKIIFENADGFEIARQDLLLRGPGEFLGARQSGLPMLRFADLEHDLDLLEQARAAADHMVRHDPERVRWHLQRWLSARQDFLLA